MGHRHPTQTCRLMLGTADSVGGISDGWNFVFRLGQSKENQRLDADSIGLARLLYRFIHGQIEHARHRPDGFAHSLSGTNEQWIYERFWSQARFADQGPE